MTTQISQADYLKAFDRDETRKESLEHALDIRKFEIDLYWKRATYFWTFIAATLAGYAAIYASASLTPKTDLLVVLSCFGIVFSFGWFCVNRGSKQWQENWENHVDMLEDKVIGPLYKTILQRLPSEGFVERCRDFVTGPCNYSVSKINQIISLYVTVLWVFLLIKALPPFSLSASINWEYVAVIGLSAIACAGFIKEGKTYGKSYHHIAKLRSTKIEPDA